jgi:hypothetical protein
MARVPKTVEAKTPLTKAKETIIMIQLDENGEMSIVFPPREDSQQLHAWEILGMLSTAEALVKTQYLGTPRVE